MCLQWPGGGIGRRAGLKPSVITDIKLSASGETLGVEPPKFGEGLLRAISTANAEPSQREISSEEISSEGVETRRAGSNRLNGLTIKA